MIHFQSTGARPCASPAAALELAFASTFADADRAKTEDARAADGCDDGCDDGALGLVEAADGCAAWSGGGGGRTC